MTVSSATAAYQGNAVQSAPAAKPAAHHSHGSRKEDSVQLSPEATAAAAAAAADQDRE